MVPSPGRRLSFRAAVIAVLLVAACGGGAGGGGCGGGCGSCGNGTYRFPLNDPNRPDAITQPEVVRTRITQAFIDFLRPQLPGLIKSALGSGGNGMRVDANDVLHIPIPDSDLFDIGVAEARLRNAEALLFLDDLAQRLDIKFETPNGVRLTLNNLRLGLNMKLKEDVAGTTSSCPIEGTLGPGPVQHAAEISVETLIEPGVGPDPDRNFDIKVTVNDIALDELELRVAGGYCNESECQDCLIELFGGCQDPGGRCAECHVFCGGLTDGILRVAGALIDLVRPLLNRVLKPVVQNFVRSALGDINGKPARFEQQVDLKTLTGIDGFKSANPFGIFAAPEPGKFPVIDRGTGLGMEVTLTGGSEAELADCIPSLADFVSTKGPVPVLGGTDGMGRPYHIGMTLAASLVNQIFYAVHRSGSLCLKLSSTDVKALTGGKFTVNASLLSLLASDLSKLATDGAPAIIELRPRSPATVELGTGQLIGQNAMGNDVYDWLVKLRIQDMGLAFHVLIQDRYVRIFEVTMDVFVGLNVVVLPDNKIEASVGDLRIDDFKEEFNEILPNADFAMILPTLIDVAMQALLTNQLKFDVDVTDALSSSLGGAPIYMRVNEIKRDGVQQDYLTLTITFSNQPGAPLSLAAETHARLAPQDALHDVTDGVVRPTGRVRLVVGEGVSYTDQRAIEYQVRVDRGVWRAPMTARPDNTLLVEDPKLVLAGEHQIEVRARYKDDYMTLDATPAELPALVDPLAPSLSAQIERDALRVSVSDVGSRAGALRLTAETGGAPREIALVAEPDDGTGFSRATASIPLAELAAAGVTRVVLVASDARGNESAPVAVRVGNGTAALESAPDASAAGCACHDLAGVPHGHGDTISVLLIALFLGLHLVRRARR